MFTSFHALRAAGVAIGLVYGGTLGHRILGVPGAILGAGISIVLGYYLGSMPEVLALRAWQRQQAGKSAAALRTELHDPSCLTVNLHLLELKHRGEEIGTELPYLLELLCSESRERRIRAWAAVTSAFPAAARALSTYRIDGSREERRAQVAPLKGTTA